MDNLFDAVKSMYSNPEGFGPGKTIDSSFEDNLFQPYYKTSERTWHVSDWTNKIKGRSNQGIVSGFAYKNDEDFSSSSGFTETKQRASYKRLTARTLNSKLNNQRQAVQKKTNNQRTVRSNVRKSQNNRRPNNRFRFGQREEIPRDPSIVLNAGSWDLVEEITFSELNNNSAVPVSQETVRELGVLEQYNSALDNTNTRNGPILPVSTVNVFQANASADPVMQELASANTCRVYGSEGVLGLLMSATNTVHSFDVLVTKTDKGVFLDSRPHQGGLCYHVNETVSDSLPVEADHINNFHNLASEASVVTQQVLGLTSVAGNGLPTDGPNPSKAGAGEQTADVVYRYRSIDLGEDVSLCVRSVIAGYVGNKEDANPIVFKTFNEADSKLFASAMEWRSTIDSQPGAVLASELKNNTARVLRAVSEVYLSGVSTAKMAWVSRVNKDPKRHQLLHVDTYDASQLPSAVRTTRSAMWGTLKLILEFLLEQDNGKYILMRDPSTNVLKIFKGKTEGVFNGVTGHVSDV